jgi:hypothetical protein
MNLRRGIDLVLISLAAVAAGATFPDLRGPVAAGWALIVLAYVLLVVTSSIRLLVGDSRFERALQSLPADTERPADLTRVERSFGWKSYSARDFDHEIRPVLCSLVEPQASRRTKLDPELRALSSERPAAELYGNVIRTPDIERMVTKIEALR